MDKNYLHCSQFSWLNVYPNSIIKCSYHLEGQSKVHILLNQVVPRGCAMQSPALHCKDTHCSLLPISKSLTTFRHSWSFSAGSMPVFSLSALSQPDLKSLFSRLPCHPKLWSPWEGPRILVLTRYPNRSYFKLGNMYILDIRNSSHLGFGCDKRYKPHTGTKMYIVFKII